MIQHFKFEEVLQLNTTVSLAWRLKKVLKAYLIAKIIKRLIVDIATGTLFANGKDIPEISKVATIFSKHIVGVCNALVEKPIKCYGGKA